MFYFTKWNLCTIIITYYVLISIRKRHVIGQNVDTWLRNWNFISQWNSKSFNHAHFQDLCSLIKLQKIAFNSFISHMILYKSYDSFWLRYLNGNATPTNRKDIQQCTIQINWQLTELDGYQKFSAIRGTAYKNKNKITGEHSIVVTDLTTNLRQHPLIVS